MEAHVSSIMRLIPLLTILSGSLALAANAPTSSKTEFLALVDAHFATWDADGDGTLTAAELGALAPKPEITGREAAAVAALKRAATNRKATPPVLTQESIAELANQKGDKNSPNLVSMYSSGVWRIARASRVLFSSGTPKLDTVHQGKLGNCFCLAPLGAMLARDPKQVESLFRPMPDGGCEVSFGTKKIRVRQPTDAELAVIASNESDGLWINYYEMAAGELRNLAKPEDQRSSDDLDAIARGGSAGVMLGVLTGNPIVRTSFKAFQDSTQPEEKKTAALKSLRVQLAAAVKERRLMTCGTVAPTTPGITPNHAYALLGFDEGTDTVRLWNPHGDNFRPKGEPGLQNGYARTDGIFTMPLVEFVQQFVGMAVEKPAS